MNKQTFIEFIENPLLLDNDSLNELKEIVEEYPFFQLGRMLILKNLHSINSIKYNSELKYSAAFIKDRSKLFQLINLTEVEPKKLKLIKKSVDDNQKKEINNTQRKRIDDYLNASNDLEQTDILGFSKHKQSNLGDEENIVLPAADLLDYERNQISPYQLEETEINDYDYQQNHSFSDWLHILRNNPTEKNEKKSLPKKQNMDLINNFIKHNPKIIPKVNNTLENKDLTTYEDKVSNDIMTETLAKIYLKQGNKLKAIEIFDRLRLKYPEKNVYFALQIKKIKETN